MYTVIIKAKRESYTSPNKIKLVREIDGMTLRKFNYKLSKAQKIGRTMRYYEDIDYIIVKAEFLPDGRGGLREGGHTF